MIRNLNSENDKHDDIDKFLKQTDEDSNSSDKHSCNLSHR